MPRTRESIEAPFISDDDKIAFMEQQMKKNQARMSPPVQTYEPSEAEIAQMAQRYGYVKPVPKRPLSEKQKKHLDQMRAKKALNQKAKLAPVAVAQTYTPKMKTIEKDFEAEQEAEMRRNQPDPVQERRRQMLEMYADAFN